MISRDELFVFIQTSMAQIIIRQAGSRRGSQRAMLRTYAWLKLSRTDTQMDRRMDRHCATIIARREPKDHVLVALNVQGNCQDVSAVQQMFCM